MQSANSRNASVKIYHGYGHAHDLIVFGHVLQKKPDDMPKQYANGVLSNLLRLIRLFFVKPVPNARVRLNWVDEPIYATTEKDGFFKFEWEAKNGIKAGLHEITVDYLNEADAVVATGKGHFFVPHITQYAFISDIDDTVLISFSATILKRLRALFFKNPHSRTAFTDVAEHYRLLSLSQTTPDVPNPFYYVSSSEWNLYNDLVAFFRHNRLPEGVFLLNQIKQWFQLLKTGKTKHEGKLLRIVRILETFPNQQFVLLGDNSQSDPPIYESVVKKYAARIVAVYIRNVHVEKVTITEQILANIEKSGVHTCFFTKSAEAIEHSKSIGLILE